MAIILDLPPEIERGLLARASACGMELGAYITGLATREALRLDSARREPDMTPMTPGLEAKNLVELFENSPFKGLGMTFERDRDYGREIVL